MTRQQSPAVILCSIVVQFVVALFCMIAVPLAIVGIITFDLIAALGDAICATRAWKWLFGRRA